jgi:hypothetical protein
MAITKQTAKRSTGEKAPWKAIAQRAARNPKDTHPPGDSAWVVREWIMFIGGVRGRWMAKPVDQRLAAFTFLEGSRNIPIHVRSWCRANPGVVLDSARCERWGLTVESDEDDVEDRGADDYDETADISSNDNDESSNSVKSKGNDMMVKTMKYDPERNEYFGRADRGRWYPLIFRRVKVHDDPSENMRQLRKFDEWCLENPNLPMQLPVGWRSGSASGDGEFTETPVLYRSEKMNCIEMAAANLIARLDARAAREVGSCEIEFSSVRRFCAWFNNKTLWRSRDMYRVLEDQSRVIVSPKAVMNHILSLNSGIFLVQPIDEQGNSPHAIGVNCFNRTVHDCAEEFVMVLSIQALSLCCGKSHTCSGFLSAHRLEMKPKKRCRNHVSTK